MKAHPAASLGRFSKNQQTCAVRQLLPIPAQPGGTIRLPVTFGLRPGTEVQVRKHMVILTRGTRRVTFETGDRSHTVMRQFLDGKPISDPELYGAEFESLCRRLLVNGMASEPGTPGHVGWAPAHGSLPGPNLVALIADLRDALRTGTNLEFPLQNSITTGECTPSELAGWFLENYHYVRSAPQHCAPVLDHEMPSVQRELWGRFLFEECWHWRIFRPMFSAFGWPWDENREDTPCTGTRELVGMLERAARMSPVVYAALLLLTEQVPNTKDMREDPLYLGAMTLGIPEKALRPLWWHAWSQCPTAHSTLGAMVISQQEVIPAATAASAISAFETMYPAFSQWGQSIREENPTDEMFVNRSGLAMPPVLRRSRPEPHPVWPVYAES